MSEHDPDNSAAAADAGLEFNDIELAYRQALEALDEAERQVGSALGDFAGGQHTVVEEERIAPGLSIGEQLAEDLGSQAESDAESDTDVLIDGLRRVSPRQVVEAALFVGGDVALTARKLASLISQEADSRVAVSLIDALNQTYVRENRPYEIRLHEGGYRMELREQYRDLSMRSFGMGPREVRLSPDVLEVLAFIAYNQPVAKEELTQVDRPNAMALLRQLLRLQLVELQRTGQKRTDVTYGTTPRFLKLFGLKSISDLPTADVFSFK